MSKLPKIYVYVDETGQDTKGKVFIVCNIVVVTEEEKNKLEKLLDIIEIQTDKPYKWHKASLTIKIKYLDKILELNQLYHKIFIKRFVNTKLYYEKTIEAIKDSLKNFEYQTAIVTIDGLAKSLELETATKLREHRLKIKKVRGLKDNQNSLLRLCDAMVGLTRDYLEAKKYSKKYYPVFIDREFLMEL